MSIEVRSTNDLVEEFGIKVLVHGPSGSGKTRLCGTTDDHDRTIIISAERGLLSLRQYDIDAIEVTSIREFREAQRFVEKSDHYRWVILDSVSEIAEVILEDEKRAKEDTRRAYGEMADRVFSIIRSFRNLPVNVVMTAKQGREDDAGSKLYVPLMPGNQLTQNISYMFDEVFALRTNRTSDGEIESALQTQRDQKYEAKDRSGALERFEEPDLAHIYNKIVETAGINEAKTAASDESVAAGQGRGGHFSEQDLSDEPDHGNEENWQEATKRYFTLCEEAGFTDENRYDDVTERLREAMQARHNVDSWVQIPADILHRWCDLLKARPTESADESETSPRFDLAVRVIESVRDSNQAA
jgi:hypothetical protein